MRASGANARLMSWSLWAFDPPDRNAMSGSMMTTTLQNYAADSWVVATEGLAELRSAVTGAVVARTGSEGLDFGAMLNHARTVGGAEVDRPASGHDERGEEQDEVAVVTDPRPDVLRRVPRLNRADHAAEDSRVSAHRSAGLFDSSLAAITLLRARDRSFRPT